MGSDMELITGILPYFFILFSYIVLSLISYVSKARVFFYLALIIIILFVGFKDIMSPDLERYAIAFENIENIRFGIFEPLFFVFSKILKILGFNYYALFFLYSFLTILFILLGIKKMTNYQAISFLFFLLVPGFFLNMFVEMRQMLAVAITFYSVALFLDKKKTWLLFAILSAMAHYSAIFFWLIFGFIYKFLPKIYSLKIYAIFSILSFVFIGIFKFDIQIFKTILPLLNTAPFFQKYINYVNYRLEGGIEQVQFQFFKNIFYIVNLLFLVYIFKLSNRKTNDIKDAMGRKIIFLNLLFIGVLILNITFYIAPISRAAYYFLIFQIVIIPNIIFDLKIKEVKVLILYSYFFIYLLMFIKGLFFYSEEAQDYIFLNYRNILFNILFKEI